MRYYNEAFVHSLYFGFLGRDPGAEGFTAWLKPAHFGQPALKSMPACDRRSNSDPPTPAVVFNDKLLW